MQWSDLKTKTWGFHRGPLQKIYVALLLPDPCKICIDLYYDYYHLDNLEHLSSILAKEIHEGALETN